MMLGSLYSELSWEGKGLLRPWDHFLGGVGTGRSGEIGCPEWYYSSGQKASGLALGMEETAAQMAALTLGEHIQRGRSYFSFKADA